jgi:hypothetical protein
MAYLLTVLTLTLTLTLTSAWTGTMQSCSRLAPILGHRLLDTRRSFLNQQLFSRSSSSVDEHDDSYGQIPPKNIAIVGGGLAGLSTAFHLLEKTSSRCQVTIFDTAPVGTAGASSVAGGYVTLLLLHFVTAIHSIRQ